MTRDIECEVFRAWLIIGACLAGFWAALAALLWWIAR